MLISIGAKVPCGVVMVFTLLDFQYPHSEELDLGFGVGQHLLSLGQEFLVPRAARCQTLDHVFRTCERKKLKKKF